MHLIMTRGKVINKEDRKLLPEERKEVLTLAENRRQTALTIAAQKPIEVCRKCFQPKSESHIEPCQHYDTLREHAQATREMKRPVFVLGLVVMLAIGSLVLIGGLALAMSAGDKFTPAQIERK